MLVFRYKPGCFPAANLLIQRIQQLLACRRAGKCRTVILRAAETAEIQQALWSTAEHNAHPVHEVDDAWRRIAHRFNRRLVRKKVSAVYRIVKMLPGGVAFTFRINRAVNAALRTNGM